MGRIFCVVNQKGGVGKTTTAVNLSAALSIAGQSTLLVDMDPQCNATTSLGIEPSDRHPLIDPDLALPTQIAESATRNLSILPGSRSFEDVERLAGDDSLSGIVRGAFGKRPR